MYKVMTDKQKHEKISRDEFYFPLFYMYGEKHILKSGFFYDNAKENLDIKTLKHQALDLSSIKKNFNAAKTQCILLTTGCFAPFHEGHLNALEVSKQFLQQKGYEVIGGVIAPAHQEYVDDKKEHKALLLGERLQSIYKLIKPFDYLTIDYFTCFYNNYDINFTDIYSRLKYELQREGINTPIFFVCGSDRADFARTFEYKGNCVVVNRPGFETQFKQIQEWAADKINIQVVPADNAMSSTQILEKHKTEKPVLFLRYSSKTDNPYFVEELIKILSPSFSHIELKDIQVQLAEFKNRFQDKKVISLDSLTPGDYNLKVSRLYSLYGTNKCVLTNRMHSQSITQQLNKIPLGEYVLFDDDIATGFTTNTCKLMLENKGIVITETACYEKHSGLGEILDVRDFIFLGENNGLTIEHDGIKTRVPYCLPYVDISIRASIVNPIEFTEQLTDLNQKYFNERNHNRRYSRFRV